MIVVGRTTSSSALIVILPPLPVEGTNAGGGCGSFENTSPGNRAAVTLLSAISNFLEAEMSMVPPSAALILSEVK